MSTLLRLFLAAILAVAAFVAPPSLRAGCSMETFHAGSPCCEKDAGATAKASADCLRCCLSCWVLPGQTRSEVAKPAECQLAQRTTQEIGSQRREKPPLPPPRPNR